MFDTRTAVEKEFGKKRRRFDTRTAVELDKVDNNFLTDLNNRVNAYFKDVESDFKNVTYGNYREIADKYSDNAQLVKDIELYKKYVAHNADDYGDDYSSIISGVNNNLKNIESINTQIENNNSYYSQFASEEALKQYEAFRDYDVEAGQSEITKLEKEIEQLKGYGRQTFLETGGFGALREYKKQDEIDKLEKELATKKAYHYQAVNNVEATQLTTKAIESVDFEKNSVYVSTKAENFLELNSSEARYGMGYKDSMYEYINNVDGYREKYNNGPIKYSKGLINAGDESPYESMGLDYMKEDEVKVYNYYYATKGKEKAEEYINLLKETLLNRKAVTDYNGNIKGTWREYTYWIPAGFDQFSTGIENLFNTSDEYIPASTTQRVSSMVRENIGEKHGAVGTTLYDVGTSVTNMLPSVLTSVAANLVVPGSGGIVGSGLMGASAAGSAYAEMINLGYSKGQARTYSALVGGSEALLQYAIGGIGKLGGKFSLSSVVSKIDNVFARVAINMGQEGIEEGLQTVLEPWFKSIVTGVDFEAPNAEDILYSSLLGFLSAGVFEGIPSTIGTVAKNISAKKTYSGSAQDIVASGLEMPEGSVAHKLANKLKAKLDSGKKLSGSELNKIVNVTDTAKINRAVQSRLTELGETSNIDVLSSAITKQITGQELTDTEQKVISESKYGQRVLNEASPENIKAGAYSSSWVNDIGTRRINADVYNTSTETDGIDGENVDNTVQNGYNTNRGEGYVRTDEFRDLQAESKGMPDEDIQLYHAGSKQLDGEIRENLARIFRSQIDSARDGVRNDNGILNLNNKGNNFNIYEGVDGSLFHDVFEIARNYLQNGELVDLHDIKTTEDGIGYDDCYNYLSEDGLSGFSITPDGDLISVFNASGKAGFLGAIAPIVKERAKTLDCYNSPNQPLRAMYEKIFGFKTAAVMDYNMEYDHDNIAANHNNPQVAFMVNTEAAVETKNFTKDQYDEAKAYRDSFVDNSDTQSSAKGVPELDISKDTRSHEEQVVEKMSGKENAREKDRREVKRLGKLLGWEVRFDDIYARDKQGNIVYITDSNGNPILDINGKPIPKRGDSKVDKAKKIITFDNSNSKPIKTLLKHELTHFLETNAGVYRDFLNKVIESDTFKKWLEKNKKAEMKSYRDSDPKNANLTDVEAYRGYVINEYKGTPGFETAESSRISAEYEMVAEFVEENLFGDGTKMVNEIVQQMNTEQRSKFAQFVDKIIEILKGFFKDKKQLNEIDILEQEWLKAYKAAEQTWQQQKNTTENSGEQYAIRKGVAKKGKSVYNEYATNVMRWANSAGTNVGDVKIFNDRGKEFVLNEATEDGYIEIARGSYEEVSGYYEEMRQRADNSFYEYTKQIRAKRDGSMRTVQHNNPIGGHTLRNSEPFGSQGLQTDTAGDNEYLRTGNKGKQKGAITDNDQAELNNSAFSMPGEEQYSLATDNEVLLSMYENGEITREEYLRGIGKTEPEGVANYTEKQYNDFGWVSYNEVVTAKEREILFSRYADYKHNKNKYPTTRFGEAVIHSTECPDVIMYIKGQIRSPQVTKVVRINADVENIKEVILRNERENNYRTFEVIKQYFGEWIFDIHYKRDYAPFRQYITEQKGRNSQSSNTVSDGEQNRGRGIKQNTENDTAGLNNSAFSMPGDEQYSLATDNEVLLSMYENGEITREEFLKGFNTKSYGLKEITDLNAEDADILQQVNKVRKETDGDSDSKFWESLQKSKWFDDGLKSEFAGDEFIEKYKSISNKETLLEAKKELEEGGADYVRRWHNLDAKHASLIDTAVGFILLDGYRRNGDTVSAVATAEKLREIGTAGGQQIQIFSILGRLSPEAMLQYAQNELDKAFEIMVEKRSKDWIDKNKSKFSLTKEDMEFIERRVLQASILPEGRDKAVCMAEIAARLQDKLPPARSQGFKAWQRISMLLNPKTNVRNFLGNATIAPVFIAADFFGTGIDKLISKKTGIRTTGMFGAGGLKENAKAFKKGAWETLDDFKRHINTRNQELNRFDLNTKNMTGKSFNENHNGFLAKQLNDCAKVLNALDRMTSFCLEMGDRPFYEMWFVNSINNQMKLNNVKEPTPEMITIASAEALQRTWQDSNSYVTMVQNIKQGLNGLNIHGYGLGDVFVKFSKTPANLTKAIVDFSPIGLVKGLSVDAVNFKNAVETGRADAITQKKFVDSLSKGIAGTMLYILFAALAANGLITGAGDEDKDANAMEKYILGVPEYSIKLFGKWWSYEWMQPVGGAMAIVADYMQNKVENPDNEWYENIIEAIRAGGEVLYNQSFMQSLQTLFTADGMIDGVVSGVLDDPSVLIPQFISQIASATDKYRRVTYSNKNPAETAINKIKVKIPGLRQTLEIDKDILGRDIENSQGNFFDAFLNPANTYIASNNDVTDEIYRLYKSTGDKTVIPRKAANSVTVKGQTHYFEIKEKNEYQRVMGETTSEILEDIFKSSEYKTLTDSEKVKLINNVFNYAVAMAKAETVIYYDVLSAIYGDALSETKYNSLSEKSKKVLAAEYFLSDYYDSKGKSKIKTTEAEYFLEKIIENRKKKGGQYSADDINKIISSN